jgi:hypothetical protein
VLAVAPPPLPSGIHVTWSQPRPASDDAIPTVPCVDAGKERLGGKTRARQTSSATKHVGIDDDERRMCLAEILSMLMSLRNDEAEPRRPDKLRMRARAFVAHLGTTVRPERVFGKTRPTLAAAWASISRLRLRFSRVQLSKQVMSFHVESVGCILFSSRIFTRGATLPDLAPGIRIP